MTPSLYKIAYPSGKNMLHNIPTRIRSWGRAIGSTMGDWQRRAQ